MRRAILLAIAFGGLLRVSTAQANSAFYQPLKLPKAVDIAAFTNGLPPGTGIQRQAKREEILRFLREGKNNLDVQSWYALEYPPHGGFHHCEGVMLDRRGQFIFWKLRSPKVLKLITPDGRYALLQLP